MALLNEKDLRQLANWYRDEITFLRWIGEAVVAGDRLRAVRLINQRREMVAAQIRKLAEAVGVDPNASRGD